MKILKIFGIVVGIHVFALILIFANPGCSSSTKRPPQPTDTLPTETGPTVTVPDMTPAAAPAPVYDPASPVIAPATGFNPDAPATYAGGSSVPAIRFTPIRPNTPAASAVTAPPVENVTPATTYTVRPGDSLWSVAKRYHTTVKDLTAANNLRSSATLREGQKLLIPAKSTGGSAAATSAATSTRSAAPSSAASTAASTSPRNESAGRLTSDEFKYVVKPGETLGAIARKFDVRTRDLAVANHISDPRNLRAGTELVIPGWQAANARNSGSGTPSPSAPAAAPEILQQPPNILEGTSNPPAADPNVPVINLDEPVTPAPKS